MDSQGRPTSRDWARPTGRASASTSRACLVARPLVRRRSERRFVTVMSKSWRSRSLVLALTVLALAPAPLAQSVAIKLATVVPDGSIWDKNLKQMAAEWKQATSDRVQVTVFSGGSQGDEPTVLRKIRLDALQGASLTVVGLANIDGAFNVFNMPFFFESYDELNAVVERLTPVLKQRVDAKGFVLLNRAPGGWLQVVLKLPVL